MNILICGSLDWNDFPTIKKYLEEVKNQSQAVITIIHGGCKGADSIGGYLAQQLGFQVRVFKADWNKYGKAAGPIRNQQMLVEGSPNLVVAFHNDLENSKGTLDMVSRARKAEIKVLVIKSPPS
jgi:YspA, cpYpsA-related SLOG family